MKRLIITQMNYQTCPCLVIAEESDGKLSRLHIEESQKNHLLGSIHVGKVQKILPNIRGAFVEIENRIPCFYPYEKENTPIFVRQQGKRELRPGDEILVQVTQEALKMKAPCVSSNLNFSGNYLVLTTENKKLGFSSKLSNEKKEELKQLLEGHLECEFGLVVRTNARLASSEQLLRELEWLKREYADVLKKGNFAPCFQKIKPAQSALLQALKHVYWDEVEKIVTDDKTIFDELARYLNGMGIDASEILQYYQDNLLALSKLYRLEHGLEQALSEKVWLKSGGFLMIQQTEACVVIDVNSGKYTSKRPVADEIMKLNLEAAKEIARQIQLRNLYGIILVDFINMQQLEQEQELLHVMKTLTRKDSIRTTIVDITALGIMEITRKKEEKSLFEQICQITQYKS